MLFGKGQQKKHKYLYWEFAAYGGQQAVRMGDWKGIRQNMLKRNNKTPLKTELYNLKSDIGESKNVADENPEVVKKIEEIMKSARTPSELFKFRVLDN